MVGNKHYRDRKSGIVSSDFQPSKLKHIKGVPSSKRLNHRGLLDNLSLLEQNPRNWTEKIILINWIRMSASQNLKNTKIFHEHSIFVKRKRCKKRYTWYHPIRNHWYWWSPRYLNHLIGWTTKMTLLELIITFKSTSSYHN